MKRSKVTAPDIADLILSCLGQCEADGYQQHETGKRDKDGAPIYANPAINEGVEFGMSGKQTLWFETAGRRFTVRVGRPQPVKAEGRTP